MKKRDTIQAFSLLLLALLMPSLAHAELKLDTPKKLLEKAAQGRIPCREVILDIEQNISEFSDPATFDSYFNILGELQKIAAEKGVDEIFPNAVKNLGQQMASDGIRWLSAARDPFERILYYHQWMNADSALSFLSNEELEEKTLKPGEIALFSTNIDRLIPFIDQAFPQNSNLRVGYRDLLSDLAAKSLAKLDLTEEERLFWLSKIYSASGYNSVISLIQDNILHLDKGRRSQVHKYVQRLLTVGNRLMFDAQNQPFWLINSLGEVAEQVVLRAIFLEEMLPQSEFEGLLHLMQAGQLQALSQNWVAHSPAETFLTNYLRLTEFFVRELKKQGLEKELTETVRFQAKIAAPLKARELNLEGTWLLSGRDKQKWVLTIAFARGTDVFLCLADSGGFVNKSFFSLAYSPDDVSFVASERERTDDPSRNRALKFKLLADGSLELRDLASDALLKGQKTQSYPNYFEDSNPSAPTSPSGKYVGTVYMGDGFVKKMTLTVSAFKGYTVASMVGDSTQISFDFNIGTAGTDGVLYLSTGSQERANYSQLRGLLKNGEFRGRAIVGGKGISDKEFLLKKVNE